MDISESIADSIMIYCKIPNRVNHTLAARAIILVTYNCRTSSGRAHKDELQKDYENSHRLTKVSRTY